jgi:cell division septum initiation protein DivIVA
MPYTPVELRHVRPSKALFGGYRRAPVDQLLVEVADSFELVWRERAEFADRLEDLEKELESFRAREQLLATTLVSAEKAAADAREQGQKQAELIVQEAHVEARSILRTAQGERERLYAEARRVEALLRSALGMVQEVDAAAAAGAEEDEDSWPRRDDTREFGRLGLFIPTDRGVQAG